MESETEPPFKVGELAEARSFEKGFRGAWFRCKIREISKRNGRLGHVSEYIDFPDEKLTWTRLYQLPPSKPGMAKEKCRELMLRPHYPPIFNEKQMPHVSEISEVAVIVDESWKVGDLVDWWTTDCYWSGTITELLGYDKAQIELNPEPFGEGFCYEVSLKDVRPSLDWSPEHGWTIPTQVGDTERPGARLIKPINQGQETEAVQGSVGSTSRLSYSFPVSSDSAVSDEAKSTKTAGMQKPSLRKTVSEEPKDEREKSTSIGCRDSSKRKTSRPDTDSRQNSTEPADEGDLKSNRCPKKNRAGEGVTLNSLRSDTLEAAVLDLEECVNKVKWLKKILKYGISSSDDAERPMWEFVETHAASEIPE